MEKERINSRNAFFALRFSEAIEEYKAKTGKTQSQFAKEIHGVKNSISKYKSGESYPSETSLGEIVSVLQKYKITYGDIATRRKMYRKIDLERKDQLIDRDFFLPQEKSDQYKYSSEYMDGLAEHIKDYCLKIGLDTSFLRFVKGIPNFERDFPLWTPIQRLPLNDERTGYYRTGIEIHSESAEMSEENSMLQMEVTLPDGSKRTISLTCADLSYLKKVQDEITQHITLAFLKRKIEMQEEVDRVQKDCTVEIDTGTGVRAIGFHPINVEDYDPYMKIYIEGWGNK